MGPIVLFETSRVRLIEYSRYRDSTVYENQALIYFVHKIRIRHESDQEKRTKTCMIYERFQHDVVRPGFGYNKIKLKNKNKACF